jgi:hypothetical protein
MLSVHVLISESNVYTLEEEGQERNQEHQENTDDATLDPVKHRDQVVASRRSSKVIAVAIVVTESQLIIQSTEIKHY